jgi:FkbH-like protein
VPPPLGPRAVPGRKRAFARTRNFVQVAGRPSLKGFWMGSPDFHWLPEAENWRERIAALGRGTTGFAELFALAHTRLDFVRTGALDQLLRRRWPERPADFAGRSYRLSILSSSTTAHLHAGLRIAGLRYNFWLQIHEGDYRQYWRELNDPGSGLHEFRPEGILFAFDAWRFCSGVAASQSAAAVGATLDAVRQDLLACWRKARAAFGCDVLQQTVLPTQNPLLGANEHRLPGSRAAFLSGVNAGMRLWGEAEGVDLVAIDVEAARDGLAKWHDPVLWHRAKQDIRPTAAPIFGDLVVRVLAAKAGGSRKCLVLDLDNTLWGGVIGDEGLDGIVLGQGSALGEGFLSVQDYAKQLSERGIILAVCSKNDEANALEPFEKHPEMVLRRADIACFVANWDDKAKNIETIAERLNIGLDSLVFLDDNPFERRRVREALPMVAVPEVPDEPALVPETLAAAGYFESVAVTGEDRERGALYAENAKRERVRENYGDVASYLAGLGMRAIWGYFDTLNRQRIVQLINKTNQFNLTTRRYSDTDYDAFMRDENCVGLHVRLVDRFGDNGLIAVVIGKINGPSLVIDTWLMSCRVLGREVEAVTLSLLIAEARRRGATRLVGEYAPSQKNGMVREHYEKLGFTLISEIAAGAKRLALEIADYREPVLPMALERAVLG